MDYAEAYDGYAAQGIRRIDAEIVKKSHFRMETSLRNARGIPLLSRDRESFCKPRDRSTVHEL